MTQFISQSNRGWSAFKSVGHLGHDEAMEAGGRECSLHGRVVKGILKAKMHFYRISD